MRALYLVDEVGTTYFFDYRTNTLITNLSGLGIERSNTYVKFDETYETAKIENSLSQISATLIFLDGYEGYKKFLNFVRKRVGKLRLFYSAETVKHAFVEIASISKTELSYGVIQSSLVIDKLSLWLERKTYLIEVSENHYSKIFPFTYPFNYSLSYNGEIEVTNNGCKKSPVRIEITGKTINPSVEIIKNGEVISRLEFILSSLYQTSKIVVESEATSQEMSLNENGVITNIYAYQNFDEDNFLFLEVGTYTIRFNPGVSDNTTCKFMFLEQYEGN